MRTPPVSTWLGILAMLFGGWWMWSALVPPITRILSGEKDSRDLIFVFTILPIVALPGILAGYFGFRLTREKISLNFKGTVGSFAVIAVAWISSMLKQVPLLHVDERLETSLFTLVGTFVVIPLYALLTAYLMRREGVKEDGAFSLIGKGAVLIVALQVWQLSERLFDVYAPIEPGYTYVRKAPWEMLGLIIPIAAAVFFYKLSMRMIRKRAKARTERADDLAVRR